MLIIPQFYHYIRRVYFHILLNLSMEGSPASKSRIINYTVEVVLFGNGMKFTFSAVRTPPNCVSCNVDFSCRL